MALLTEARLLVPVVAHPGAVDDSGPLRVETSTEMASVVLTAPDGRRALPVFTGADSLAAWDPTARPVPVVAGDAARAAVDQGCQVMLVDLGSEHAAVLRLSQLWALAQGRRWLEPHLDSVVRDGVAGAAARIPQLTHVTIREPGGALEGTTSEAHVPPGVLSLVLDLVPGLTRDHVASVAEQLGQQLSADPEVRIRIDGLAVSVRGASSPD